MNQIKFRIFALFCLAFLSCLQFVQAQGETEARMLKMLKEAPNDTVRQLYHNRLCWQYSHNPRAFVAHFIEGNILKGNLRSEKEGTFSSFFFQDSLSGFKREGQKAKDLYKKKGDKRRELAAWGFLSMLVAPGKEKDAMLKEMRNRIEGLPDGKDKEERLNSIDFDLLTNNASVNDPRVNIELIRNEISKNRFNLGPFQRNELNWFLGSQFSRSNRPDSAIYYEEKFFNYLKVIGGRKEYMVLMAAELLIYSGQFQDYNRCRFYTKFLESNLNHIKPYSGPLSTAYLCLSLYYMNVEASQKEWSKTKSKAYLDSTAILLKSGKVKDFDHSSTLINYYSYSAEWARLFGEYELGYQYLYRLNGLSDSIHSVRSLTEFNEMQIKYEVARKEKDLEIANQKSTLQMLWFGGAFTLLLIVSLVIFFYVRNRNKIRSLEQMLRVRNRISSDLHDDVGSALSSITIITDMVRSQLRNNPEKAGELLEKISETSIEVMGSMKDIVWSINPKNDSLESLLNKIREFASDILDSRNIGLVMEDETNGVTHLDLAFRQDVYLILKEAINNIAKYSKATLVKIRIFHENEAFCIEISDNGIGFQPDTVEEGNGLGNMKNRAEKMGGTLNIQSADGGGTKITLRV